LGKFTLSGATVTGDGTSWLVLSGVLYRFDPGRRLLEPVPGTDRLGPILAGQDGSVWFATARPENPLLLLARFEPGKGVQRYYREQLPGEGTVGGGVVSMLEDRKGDIWFGTFGRGLYRFDPQTKLYRHYSSAPGVKGALKTSVVRVLRMDSSGVIWIGTDSGLHRYIPETDSFERFTTTGREANDQGHFIRGMAFDQRGDLWLAHSGGISRFDRRRARFRDFTEVDGLKRTQYFNIAFEPLSRTMYAADLAGFIVTFRPEDLPTNVSAGRVILTDFRVFENPVSLPEPINRMRGVTLSHDQNFFSFRFSALEFLRTDKVNYAYKMEGFDRDWVQAGSRAYAGYTNLDHGSYVFQVKATDADGVWSDSVTTLSVVVHPPWWETPWAYSLFTLVIISVLYGAWRYDRRRVQLRHQLEMKGFEARKLLEVDQLKTRFFANISHECRTPLTLILGPAGKLRSRLSDPDARRDLETIERNANSLLGLINRLLDLSKLDAGRMVLQVCPMDLVPLLKRLVASFASLADRKRVTLVFDPHDHELVACVDQEKLETIVINLLSNAFKFTDTGGEIVVMLRRRSGTNQTAGDTMENTTETGWVEISVTDTGVGIPEEKLEKVFDRFYQVDGSSTRTTGGTGIGLSLAQELVELHRGTIHVASKVGEGSTFVVGLPLGKEKYAPDQIVQPAPGLARETDRSLPLAAEVRGVEEDEGGTAGGPPSAPIVLIVEDNAELRRYIREYLENDYRVAEAADGVEGLDRAFSMLPDLVITDIMMPRMDGVELCRRLKNDDRTSHIPVIVLTARASGESKMEALETGGDDYIIKPFEVEELVVRVRNLIETRRELREKFRENIVLQPGDIAVTSSDARFLKRLMESIERHMAEPDCDTQSLARDVCMSRMQLNRKLKALTGHSTHEFLRAQRLKRAAQLLHHHGGNISEVAYEVGFASPSHFAQAFKEQFGVSPSDYEGIVPESGARK
jgi:signal transduction histidine kinase/DNA-binding response OmpR family regulator